LRADVNGDGLPDLVIVPQLQGSIPTPAAVILNRGGGRFENMPLSLPRLVVEPDFAAAGVLFAAAGLLSTGSGASPGAKLPGLFLIGQNNHLARLDSYVVAFVNASTVSNSYWAEVNSPGSYGGYHFGFVSGSPVAAQALSGTAYTDVNANGRQDPGEPNLVNQQVRVTLRDAGGTITNQAVQTDAAGRYRVGGGTQVILSVHGFAP